MANESQLKIRLQTQGAPEANRALDGIKQGVEGLSTTISTATRALRLFSSAMMIYAVAERLITLIGKVREETLQWARSTREAAKEAERLHLTAAALDAIRTAAAEANTPVDLLDKALADYRSHIITFQELAAAIGSTAAAIDAIETAQAPGRAGRDYLEKLGRTAEAEEKTGQERKAERAGLRAATEAIRTGSPAEQQEGWDVLMRAAQGDPTRAGELYNQHKSWLNRRAVGVLGYGHHELQDASGRYAANQAADAQRRADAIAEHDARVQQERDAEAARLAEIEAARQADEKRRQADREKIDADRRQAEYDRLALKAHEDEVQREQESYEHEQAKIAETRLDLSRVQDAIAKAIENVRIDQPQAASASGRSGGIIGNQIMTAERAKEQLAERRHAATEALHREELTLLAAIKALLDE